ncbi:toll/interleukin-1 receptor domain-containing protein [Glutamicibacter creatinolyticus]|uniref:toll/interleukin-1 receptor domain-containing protein n=1 Tax=Glutamicibacter creatinolyticus TaxID=162496 RepID=UPI003217058C
MSQTSLAKASSSKIEGFLSYAHGPDEFLNLAEPLHRDLVNVIKLRSNRDIEIFRDRHAIAWGDRWKSTIDTGLANASVLFVIATTHYLASENCRGEFLDFLNAAKSSEITDARRLILPIMPMKSSVFNADSEDEVAREIAEIQFELIEDAVIDGEGSPAWKRALIRLADRFIEVVEQAEAQAVIAQETEYGSKGDSDSPDSRQTDGENSEALEEPGFLDAIAKVEEDFTEMTDLVNTMGSHMTSVVAPMGEIDIASSTSAKEMNAKVALIAKKMTPDSQALGNIGRDLRDRVNSIDVNIRSLVRLAKSDEEHFAGGVRDFLKTAQSSMSVATEVEDQMEDLLTSMAPAEAASSIMRNALKPMRSGIVAFSDAIRVMSKWGPALLDN